MKICTLFGQQGGFATFVLECPMDSWPNGGDGERKETLGDKIMNNDDDRIK